VEIDQTYLELSAFLVFSSRSRNISILGWKLGHITPKSVAEAQAIESYNNAFSKSSPVGKFEMQYTNTNNFVENATVRGRRVL